ncbi:MAG: outer membrane lipoprotein carrier protein LolA, partial [Planctomycetota bacterium]|nr:outer membrane lipoprotein carrier protein LolA [Planctomycetota bacterium]
FRARFVQKKQMAISKEPVVSEGVFSYLLRADGKPLVRWDTQKPGPGRCLVTARELAVYYVDLKEAEIYELSRANPLLTRLMLAPRVGSGIFEAFSVELEPTGGTDRETEPRERGPEGDKSDPERDGAAGTGPEATDESKGDSEAKDAPGGGPADERHHVLLLKPTDSELAKFIEHVRLWLDAVTLLVEKFEYKDTSKDVTFVEFHDAQVNTEMNESEFVLDLPADVKVRRFSASEAGSAGR